MGALQVKPGPCRPPNDDLTLRVTPGYRLIAWVQFGPICFISSDGLLLRSYWTPLGAQMHCGPKGPYVPLQGFFVPLLQPYALASFGFFECLCSSFTITISMEGRVQPFWDFRYPRRVAGSRSDMLVYSRVQHHYTAKILCQ